MALTPPGRTTVLPIVARQPVSCRGRTSGQHGLGEQPIIASRRSASLVVPAWLASPGSRSRHRPCGQISVPMATGRPRSIRPRPCSTCSSTKAPTRRSASGSGPMSPGRRPEAAQRLGHAHAVAVGQAERPVGRQRSGDHPGTRAGDAEPGTLLVAEVHDPDRSGGPESVGLQGIERGEGADHPERPVKGAAVGNAVEMRPGGDAGRRVGVGVTPPRPLVAHPVGGQVQPARSRFPGEPFPQGVVLGRSTQSAGSRRCGDRARSARSAHCRRRSSAIRGCGDLLPLLGRVDHLGRRVGPSLANG